MSHPRRKLQASVLFGDQLCLNQSFQLVTAGRVQEQMDQLALLLWIQAWVKGMAKLFGPASWMQNTNTLELLLIIDGKQVRVLDSSFLLLRFFPQHRLHDSDFGALATVNIGYEIKYFSVLSRARRVEQVFYHD